MMRAVRHNTNATVRQIIPALSGLMAVMLALAFGSLIWFLATRGLDPLFTPTGARVRTVVVLTVIVFFALGLYWKDMWTFVLKVRADRLARRYDYFELTAPEVVMLCSEEEWSGEVIAFLGLGRTFAHFDNEQDRVLFRLHR